MVRHFDQRAIERAAVLLQLAARYSADELDAALKAGRHALECSFKEINAGGDAGRTLIEAINAARSFVRNRC
jgi:hypothetical protein